MKKVKDYILNIFNGFCMALADSVPGVSGGTVAFLLGFYDNFINSLDDLFRGSMEKKKEALKFLIKIGIGWALGFVLAATALSSLFTSKIYEMSSLFLGFILFAIPLVIKQEKDSVKGKYKNIVFLIIGALIVVGITLLSTNLGLDINLSKPNLLTYGYIFLVASIAITAMVLPGISGSTLLLVFGIYIPIMNSIKKLLTLDFSVLPIIIVFGIGVIFGIVTFVKLIRIGLTKFRSQIVYLILGMMLGSLYSIVVGPTTLDVPMSILSIKTFNILFFIIGGAVIILLEVARKFMEKKENK